VSAETGQTGVAWCTFRGILGHAPSLHVSDHVWNETRQKALRPARVRFRKTTAQGDGLYLTVKSALLKLPSRAVAENALSDSGQLELPRTCRGTKNECQRTGNTRVTALQRSQRGDGGSSILGAEKASVRGALRVSSSEAGDSRIATLTPLPPYPREWVGRRAASDGDEDACRPRRRCLTTVRWLAQEVRSSA